MPRSLEAIARDIAEQAVSTAQAAGYSITDRREKFFRIDVMKLEDEVLIWLQDHMCLGTADTQ